MVLNSLMHELDSNHYSPIYVRGNNLTEVELHKTILNSLDHQPPYQSGAAKRLFYRVVSELSKQPVVFIDDAQEMHDTALLALKSMANFDSDSPHKITFVLCGQPELTAALKLSRYLALKQRIRLFFHMQGMSLQETCAYIDHHTTAAGKPTSIFADDAKSDVYRCSGGIPHRVNLICYRSIVNAALNEITIIDSERYIGTGCGECPVKEKCTKGKQRSLYIVLSAKLSFTNPAKVDFFSVPNWDSAMCRQRRSGCCF